MVFKPEKLIGAALLASLAAVGAANANGFSRGTADTDILYENGDFDIRMGAAIVTPNRGYESLVDPLSGPAAGTDGDYTNTYAVPSAAYKFNFTDSLRCAGTYSQPFGANVSYGPQAIQAGINADIAGGNFTTPNGTEYSKFTINEFGLTCGHSFAVGPGKLWILGGAFVEDIHYKESARIGSPGGPAGVLDLKESNAAGYRIGAAYEIPDIALRIQGMYRSEVEHNLTGTFDVSATPTVDNPAATGSATFPQSFELKAQTGVAPGWLVFGSIKWTDWSVFDKLNYVAAAPDAKEFYFKDGWTYSLGVGHQFNDMISGSLSLTYDAGVSTTEDVNKDIITLATGLQIKTAENAKLSFGGAVSYLEGGSTSAETAGCNPTATECRGSAFAYTVGGDWVYTVGGQFVVNF
jgi:long-chain fatty acid transport protein